MLPTNAYLVQRITGKDNLNLDIEGAQGRECWSAGLAQPGRERVGPGREEPRPGRGQRRPQAGRQQTRHQETFSQTIRVVDAM